MTKLRPYHAALGLSWLLWLVIAQSLRLRVAWRPGLPVGENSREWLAFFTLSLALVWITVGSLRKSRPSTVAAPRRVAAALATALVVIGVLELGVRVLVGWQPDVFGEFYADSVLGWRLRPDANPEINHLGMRGPAAEARPAPGELRVLCVGDSCTFGVGLGIAETYPARLQEALASSLPGRTVCVLNAGVPGYSSAQGLQYLTREGLALGPHFVVWSFRHNDSNSALWPDSEVGPTSERLEAVQRLLQMSRLYVLTRAEIARLILPRRALRQARVSLAAGRRILRAAAAAASPAGARLIFLVTPDQEPSPPGSPLYGRKRFLDETTEEARQLGLPVISPWAAQDNLAPGMLGPDGVHPNAQASQILARAVAREVLKATSP